MYNGISISGLWSSLVEGKYSNPGYVPFLEMMLSEISWFPYCYMITSRAVVIWLYALQKIRGFRKLALITAPSEGCWPWASVWNGTGVYSIWTTGLMPGCYLTVPGGCILRLTVKESPPPLPFGQTIPPKAFFIFWEDRVKRPKDSNAYSLILKQDNHSYTLTIHTKGFDALHSPLLQRRISYSSEPNPSIERHVAIDLKCGHFHKTKSLAAAPGCRFVLKPFICHHWVNRTKSKKILVSHCTESWHLRVNSSQAFSPKQEFFL